MRDSLSLLGASGTVSCVSYTRRRAGAPLSPNNLQLPLQFLILPDIFCVGPL